MNITTKDAQIVDTSSDDEFPGTFRVILSAPTEDRDGETLLPEDWKMPLPDHITFDADHAMSVAGTVGSGTPSIEEGSGNLIVDGSYTSLPEGQRVRTLVNEKHIRTVSVAFMSMPAPAKGGKTRTVRELLNGAFVAVPSNREALVLASKSVSSAIKAGARNSAADAGTIQSIHDATTALGADCSAEKSLKQARRSTKAVAGSLEATQERIRDALEDAYPGQWVWLRATLSDEIVFELDPYYPAAEAPAGVLDSGTYRQAYSDDGTVVSLTGDPAAVDLMEIVRPDPDQETQSISDPALAAPAKAAPAPADTVAQDEADIQVRAARIRALSALADSPAP